ncbi:hypothetical protein [Butyrivibrio sp. WCE2006]|uniref:hypothetical protein n=1 Tax=Butyrivibrio sp. WCE2006 TaxID=1410611 RepID=UPI0005D1B0C4|nr:hypothetical protein [Butyrivibrio sp. WCE2006]
MRKFKFLLALPLCAMLLFTPATSITAGAVTVDINDNYDAGLLGEESNSGGNQGDEQTPANDNANAAASEPAGATNAADAANAASTVQTVTPATPTTPTDTATTTDQTNDLPRTGDDDRITMTFIGMLASFSVFLLALMSGKKIGKTRD